MSPSDFSLLHLKEPIKKQISNGASPRKVHMAVVLAGNKNDFCIGDKNAKNIMIHFLLIEAFVNGGFLSTQTIDSSSFDNFE